MKMKHRRKLFGDGNRKSSDHLLRDGQNIRSGQHARQSRWSRDMGTC